MASITVTGLTDEFVERLERKASANDRSLEEEARYILAREVEDDTGIDVMEARREAFLRRARELRKLTAERPQTSAEVLIRADRDSDHGRLWRD